MSRFANKTFYKFLFGFIAIVTASFVVITGASYLSNLEAEKNVAQVVEDSGNCLDANCK